MIMNKYDTTRYNNSIYMIENFITKEEQEYFLNKVNSVDKNFWQADGKIRGRKTIKLKDEELDLINKRMRSLFLNITGTEGSKGIQRLAPGMMTGRHLDNRGGLEPYTRFGLIIYLNGDFNGGEVEYPDFNLFLKPKERSLIFHPSDLNHGVKQILDGPDRYFFTEAIHGTENTKVNIDKLSILDV